MVEFLSAVPIMGHFQLSEENDKCPRRARGQLGWVHLELTQP